VGRFLGGARGGGGGGVVFCLAVSYHSVGGVWWGSGTKWVDRYLRLSKMEGVWGRRCGWGNYVKRVLSCRNEQPNLPSWKEPLSIHTYRGHCLPRHLYNLARLYYNLR